MSAAADPWEDLPADLREDLPGDLPAPPATPGAPVSITVCPNGPLLVRGDVEVLDAEGAPVPRRRRTMALCRCGATGLAPYCDGSHKAVGWAG